METKEIIKKWYSVLGFAPKYDAAFYDALQRCDIDEMQTVETYDIYTPHSMQNLLYYLYFCEEMQRRYAEKGIDESILMDTLADLPRWVEIDSKKNGTPGLENLDWMHHHMSLNLFKLGRLQYCPGDRVEIEKLGVKETDTVLTVHIPQDGPLLQEDCIESLDLARAFYKKFYPELDWKCFTCNSWLLAKQFADMLGEESNIAKFQKLFHILSHYESDSVLSYVFGWGLKRSDAERFEAKSSFAKKLIALLKEDAVFYRALGYIEK